MTEEKLINPEWKRPTKSVAVETKTSGDTVMVALNRIGGVKFPMPDGRKVEIHGNSHSLKGQEMGILPTGGEYGLTMIAKEDWEYIVKTYGSMAIFRNGLCFAAKKEADAKQEAESRADLRNGFEPIDPETDPNMAMLDDKEGKPKRGRKRG